MPSLASSLKNAVAKPGLLGLDALVEVALWETFLICATAIGACPASLRAQETAVSNISWSGTTRLTRPSS